MTAVLAKLREIQSFADLRESYENRRDELGSVAQESATGPTQEDLDLARVLRMAYALRNIEIGRGRSVGEPSMRPPPLDRDAKDARSIASSLAVELRHDEVTAYHLLRALMKSPLGRDLGRYTRFLDRLDEWLRTAPSSSSALYVGPEDSRELRHLLEAATNEAAKRHLDYVAPAMLLYVLVGNYVADLIHLDDDTITIRNLQAELERLAEKDGSRQ